MRKGNFQGKGRPIVKYRDTAVICAKTAEPIEMLFKEAQVQLYSLGDANLPHGKAHWHHLANTSEPSTMVAMQPYVKLL